MQTININVPVKYINGKWVAGTPASILLKGERGSPFHVRIILRYIGAEPAPGSQAKRIETSYSDRLLQLGATTDEYFEFSGFYQDAVESINVHQETAFRRPEGATTSANLSYNFTINLIAFLEPALPDGPTLYVPPTQPTLYLKEHSDVSFNVIMLESYAGDDVRTWKLVSFKPVDPNESEVEFLPRIIESGISVKAILQKNANYILILQPGDDSSDRQNVYVTTKVEP